MGFNKRKNIKNILGENWFINHDIIFDRKNNLLGIVEADCYQNKNINKTSGLELIDINSIYSEKMINYSITIIVSNIIIICGIIIIFILLYNKAKKRKINKKLIIKEDKLVNNIDIV